MALRWSEWWRDQLARRGPMGLIGDLWLLSLLAALVIGFLLGWISHP